MTQIHEIRDAAKHISQPVMRTDLQPIVLTGNWHDTSTELSICVIYGTLSLGESKGEEDSKATKHSTSLSSNQNYKWLICDLGLHESDRKSIYCYWGVISEKAQCIVNERIMVILLQVSHDCSKWCAIKGSKTVQSSLFLFCFTAFPTTKKNDGSNQVVVTQHKSQQRSSTGRWSLTEKIFLVSLQR